MKKTVLALTALITLHAGTLSAAPVNDLGTSSTALGIGSDGFYIEHKLADSFSLGFQTIDYVKAEDLYGEFTMSRNVRGIVGNRNFDSSDSKMYLGMAVNGSLSPQANGYASLIAGSQFKELQVGANFNLSRTTDLNLMYHSYMPDAGSNKSGLGVGATFKF